MRRINAYTIIELVMAIVIISIMAVVGIVAINSYKTQYLRAAAERIAADLKYAKNLALSSTKWTGAVFYISPANSYSLYQTDGATDALIKKPQDPSQDFTVNLAENFQGVAISSVNINNGDKVEFDSYGAPYDDKNGAALTSDGTITLASGSSSAMVCIAKDTGRIYIQ